MDILLQVLEFALWEAGVAAISLAAVLRFRPLSMRLPLFLSLHIMIGALSAAAVSHARWNGPAAYRILAIAFLAIGAVLVRRGLLSTARQLARLFRPSPGALVIWSGLGGLLALSIRPLEEGDSLYNLHYVAGWIHNLSTPYTFSYNYVPLWDLRSVPALVLTRSDHFFWFQSLQPVLLLGAALWLIGRELRMPRTLALWSIAAVMMFPHLWLGPSGVSTNKNDMVNAAGYGLLALVAARCARGKAGRADVLSVGLAAAFISVKASGPVMMLLGGAAVVFLARNWIRRNFRRAFAAAVAVGAVWFAAVGHYYLHNYLAFGNPVYPYQINLGPLHLPGRADLSATSILYSLGNPDVWRFLFLPEGGLSPNGLLFPVILAVLLPASAWLAIRAVGRRRLGVAEALAVFQLLAWGVYFRSVYSASGWPGDLTFLRNDLNSTRYVEGPLLVGMLCLVWGLHRLGAPRVLMYALLGVQAATCLLVVLRRAPDKPWLLMAMCGVGLAIASMSFRRRLVVPAGAALLIAGLLAGAHLVERRRPLWIEPLQPLYRALYDAPAQNLFYIIDDEFSPQLSWHWPMLGRRLQHGVQSGPRSALAALEPKPAYVAWVRATPESPAPAPAGYEPVAETARGMVLRRK